MGETLRADEATEMEKQIKDEVQNSKLKNGEAPLLDPTTHHKLMRLFSRNTNVNLCLPVIKLHRLEARDLRGCQGLSDECADYVRVELRKLKRNARRRAQRKLNRTTKENPDLVKPILSTLKNLTNGVDKKLSECDDGVAGPSKEVFAKKKCAGEDKNSGSSKRLKTEFKKKKIKKEKNSANESDEGSPESGNSAGAKTTRWEEQYLPTLAGPRAPLPPAPLLKLDLPRPAPPMRPLGISKPFSLFESDISAAPLPPLKPIHTAVLPNPQRGLSPSLSVPPPLHVGSQSTRPVGPHHPYGLLNRPNTLQQELMSGSRPMISFRGNILNTPIRKSHPGVLPAAPNLVLQPEASAKPPPMVGYRAPVPRAPRPRLMSVPLPVMQQPGNLIPVVPHLGKGPMATSQQHPLGYPNMTHRSGVTSTNCNPSSVLQCAYSYAGSASNMSSLSRNLPAEARSAVAASSEMAKNCRPSEVLCQIGDPGNLRPPVTGSSVLSSLSSLPHLVSSASSPMSSAPSKPTPQTSAAPLVPNVYPVCSFPSTGAPSRLITSLPCVTDSVSRDSFACSPQILSTASSKIAMTQPCAGDFVSNSSPVSSSSLPSTLSRIVSSKPCVADSVPSVSSSEGVVSVAPNPQIPLVLVPISTSYPNVSAHSSQAVTGSKVSVSQSSPATSVSQLFLLLSPSSAKSTSVSSPVVASSHGNTVVDYSQAVNGQSVSDRIHEQVAVNPLQVSSPSFKKPSKQSVVTAVSSPTPSVIMNKDQTHRATPSEYTKTLLTALKVDTSTSSAELPGTSSTIHSPSATSSPKSPPTPKPKKLLVGFHTTNEFEDFIIEWIKEKYEVCQGADIEQYKVQGHFQSHLYAKGRRHGQPYPILNCLKKAFGEEITTRRHRAETGQQRWHYAHVRPRKGVSLPTITPPKSRVRKRTTSHGSETMDSKPGSDDREDEGQETLRTPCDEMTIKVTNSLAVLTHLINTTKIRNLPRVEDKVSMELEISSGASLDQGMASSSSADPLAIASGSDDAVSDAIVTGIQSSPKNSAHLNEWIQSKLSSGKKVRVATLVVCLKKLHHCQVTNIFMKRNRITMRSGLRIRQTLRTWDIRCFLRAGGKKCFPSPLGRSRRLPKVGPLGSKSAAVQEMLLQARIGVEDELLTDDIAAAAAGVATASTSTASSTLQSHNKPTVCSSFFSAKKQPKDDQTLRSVHFEKITPFLNKRDKYLLMKNERLTLGQKKFTYWLGYDLAKRALKNRRLDRVEGSKKRLDLSFFGLKEDLEPSSWSLEDDVQGGKKGTTVVCNSSSESKSSANAEVAKKKPRLLPKAYPPPPYPGQAASTSALPPGYSYPPNSRGVPLASHRKVFATVAFPPRNTSGFGPNSVILSQASSVQTTASGTGTIVCSASQAASLQDYNRGAIISVATGSDKDQSVGPNNRASPPPRLTFMGGNTGYVPSNIRENPVGIRIQRPMPPPLSFMGPAVESQGRQPSHSGVPQAHWSGNVDYHYPQAHAMRNYGVINHTRQILNQHSPQQSHNMQGHVIPHQQFTNASHTTQGNTMLEKQLSQPHNVPGQPADQRPSSLPHSAQGHVVLEQRPSSEPHNVEGHMQPEGGASTPSTPTETQQPHTNQMHYSAGQYTGSGNSRSVYNYTHQSSMEHNSGLHSGQSHAISNQQLYNQSHHVQEHSFSHQQQPNLQHHLPGHMLPNQQMSSQPYARGYMYPNQQMHSLQSRVMMSQQQHRSHPQDGQVYMVPRQQQQQQQQQQSLNQTHSMQGYTSSQTNNSQSQDTNQQLSSSSYSIQNLMLPVQQHYRGPNLGQECTSAVQTPNSSHGQGMASDANAASTAQNMERQAAADSQETWSKQQQVKHAAATPGDQTERSQADPENNIPVKAANAEVPETDRSSVQVNKATKKCDVDEFGKLPNTEELNSLREGKSVITQALPRHESSGMQRQTRYPQSGSVEEKLSNVKGGLMYGEADVSRQNYKDVELKNMQSKEFDQEQYRKSDGINFSGTQASGKVQAMQEHDLPGSVSQRESQGILLPQMSLDFTEKPQNTVLVTQHHPNGNYFDNVQASSASKPYKADFHDKDSNSSFVNTQEQLPCDLDQINVSRFGLEENLNFSSILQDTDKRSYQRDGLFDKLENQQVDLSKEVPSNSTLNYQPVNKETPQESNQFLPSSSVESVNQEPGVSLLTGNLADHMPKVEALLLRLVEIGLSTSYESIMETAVQLLEIEGVSSGSCQEVDLRKWYEEFSSTQGSQVLGKTKKHQLPVPAENDVALWINKVKGEMLTFSDVPSVRIFYMQELNFFLDKRTRQIKFHKMFTDNKNCSNEKDTVSVLFTFNAEGQIGPGMIIFPRMVIPEKLFASLRNTKGGKEWVIGSSANGWLYSDCISEFVSDVFIPWLEAQQLQQPVALFTSEYISNIPLTEMCQNFVPQGVHLILVPKAMSPVVSPAEKIVVRHFITHWGKAVRDWSEANDSQQLLEENFAPFVISSIRDKIFNGEISKTFRELGIWPFDGRLVFEQFQHTKL